MRYRTAIQLCCMVVWAIVSGCSSTNAGPVTFRDFSGACQGGKLDSPCWNNALGWNRFDLTWSGTEPAEGKYSEEYLAKKYKDIKANLDHGIKVLPVLGYAPGWASAKGEYTFESGNTRKVYTKLAGNKYKLKEYRKNKDGKWSQREFKGGKTECIVTNPRIPLAPENVKAWEKFIHRVTSDLRKPPYNIEYFQIWNEAHPRSGFYDGDLGEYLKNIHIPAAGQIKALGGKVVYGGFPCVGAVHILANHLTKAKAWNSIDVLDIHYFPEWCMDYLLRKSIENGRPDMGVWQTEVVFHRKYYYVSQLYPTVLYWGLTHNWDYVDRYKLFFFALWSPDAEKAYGYGKCILAGNKLTPHGQALETLAGIFGKEPIKPYDKIISDPPLEFTNRGDRIAAFHFGTKILVVTNFESKSRQEQDKKNTDVVKLSLPAITASKVKSVQRIGVFGEASDLADAWQAAGQGITIDVPLKENEQTRYKSKFLTEKSLRRPVVYTLIELKEE